MIKIVSRRLGTSSRFDYVRNDSEICLQHISPCCYTKLQKMPKYVLQSLRMNGSKELEYKLHATLNVSVAKK